MTKKAPTCIACQATLQSIGQLRVRVGGSSGGWHILLGEWADMSEGVRPLDAYRCPKCARLEFYDHDFSLPEE